MQFLTQHTFGIVIAIVLIFLLWQFWIAPKFNRKEQEEKKANDISEPGDDVITRIKKGFKIMKEKARDKVKNSGFGKNLQVEQDSSKSDDMMPLGLIENSNKKEDDPFATDFSKLNKVEL